MSIHGVLGESTSYPKTYNPQVLYPIPRSLGRDDIAIDSEKLTLGVDWWHAFEVSWLNLQGISQVAVARFSIPSTSKNIVESKSLKLYLNSINFTEFDNRQAVQETIARDLSQCVEDEVRVELFDLNQLSDPFTLGTSGYQIDMPHGQCIDNALQDKLAGHKLPLYEHPQPKFLISLDDIVMAQTCQDIAIEATGLDGISDAKTEDELEDKSQDKSEATLITYQFYTNLLRSNCPVTNQPDWGRVAIDITTKTTLDEANLLAYILSYRQHNGFHEHCVEQIFADLTQYFKPTKLMVRAWYTRRGGIDINPCRVSDMSLLPKPSRLVRQ